MSDTPGAEYTGGGGGGGGGNVEWESHARAVAAVSTEVLLGVTVVTAVQTAVEVIGAAVVEGAAAAAATTVVAAAPEAGTRRGGEGRHPGGDASVAGRRGRPRAAGWAGDAQALAWEAVVAVAAAARDRTESGRRDAIPWSRFAVAGGVVPQGAGVVAEEAVGGATMKALCDSPNVGEKDAEQAPAVPDEAEPGTGALGRDGGD